MVIFSMTKRNISFHQKLEKNAIQCWGVPKTLPGFIYLFIYSLFIVDSFTIEHIHT